MIPRVHTTTCEQAAAQHNMELLTILRKNGAPWGVKAFAAAASKVNAIPIMAWMQSEGCPVDGTAFVYAARNGHIANVVWLAMNTTVDPMYEDMAMYSAMEKCHKNVIEWMLTRPMSHRLCQHPTTDLEIIRMLKDKNININPNCIDRAILKGAIQTVVYLRENGIQFVDDHVISAIVTKNLEMLIYLHQEGAPLTKSYFTHLQNSDHRDVEKMRAYLINNKCPGYEGFI
jgi:hypothetical protein